MRPLRDPERARQVARELLEDRDACAEALASSDAGATERRLAALRAARGDQPSGGRRLVLWLVPLAASLIVLFLVRELLDPAGTERVRLEEVVQLLETAEAGGTPKPQEEAALAALVPSGVARRLSEDPRAAEIWDSMRRLIPDGSRDGQHTPERLLSPRAGILETRPSFRFEVPPSEGRTWHYVLIVSQGDEEIRAPFERGPEAGPLSEVELPPGVELLAGTHRWRVELSREHHPDYVDLYRPMPTTFEVVPDGDILQRIDSLETGSPSVDRLIRSAWLLELGLAARALDELEGVAVSRFSGHVSRLRAEALARLGDADGFAKEKASALGD